MHPESGLIGMVIVRTPNCRDVALQRLYSYRNRFKRGYLTRIWYEATIVIVVREVSKVVQDIQYHKLPRCQYHPDISLLALFY